MNKGRSSWMRRHPAQRVVRYCFLTCFVIVLFLVGAAVSVFAYTYCHTDYSVDEMLFSAAKGDGVTRLYYTDPTKPGETYYAVEWSEQRIRGTLFNLWCDYDEIPDTLKEAFVAIEDKRFFQHEGVDWQRTGLAAVNYLLHYNSRFGGSTITQQVIKNISSDDEITPTRKLREICRAIHLEKNHSKQEILELYLNIVPLSGGCVGVRAAAQMYFDKEISDLSLAECATIAAVTNSPIRYDPRNHPEENQRRRLLILEEMCQQNYIDVQKKEKAAAEKVTVLDRETQNTPVYSWYTETVINDVIADLQKEKGLSPSAAAALVYGGGLRIDTCMDAEIQSILEDCVSLRTDLAGNLQCALVVVNPRNGNLLGVIGAKGEKKNNRLMNYATQACRAPGSALKPLSVYAPALQERKITWASVFDDVPVRFLSRGNGEYTSWPHNSPAVYSGLTDVRTAVALSKNTVAVRILQSLGVERSYAYLTEGLSLDTLVGHEAGGTKTDLAEAPLALGQLTNGVTLRDLTQAYTSLADAGVYRTSRSYLRVRDRQGNLLLEKAETEKQVFRPTVSYIMTELLRGVVRDGTAKNLTVSGEVQIAGKTGTSGENRDKWFVGYSPDWLMGIWCGYPDGKTAVPKEYSQVHLQIWDAVANKIQRKYGAGDGLAEFERPATIVQTMYCRDSGMAPTRVCALDPRENRIAWGYFEKGTLPHGICSCHVAVLYDKVGGGVAGDDCPAEQVETVGLIMPPKREFPVQIYVTDAQYVYRDCAGYPMTKDKTKPFFAATLSEGKFSGISFSADGVQYNASCTADHKSTLLPPQNLWSWFRRRFGDFPANPEKRT